MPDILNPDRASYRGIPLLVTRVRFFVGLGISAHDALPAEATGTASHSATLGASTKKKNLRQVGRAGQTGNSSGNRAAMVASYIIVGSPSRR